MSTSGGITPQSDLPQSIPQPYYEPASPESQAHRSIRRMDWEALKRCVDRIKDPDRTALSWSFAFYGAAISAAVGTISVWAASNGSFATHVALVFLGLVTAFSLLGGEFCRRMEKGNAKNRGDFLQALKDEMQAMEKYMTAVSLPDPPKS